MLGLHPVEMGIPPHARHNCQINQCRALRQLGRGVTARCEPNDLAAVGDEGRFSVDAARATKKIVNVPFVPGCLTPAIVRISVRISV